jgi:two-component system chemotaxis response regulator CheY
MNNSPPRLITGGDWRVPTQYAKRSALVIDDHPFMREIVRSILRDIGFGRITTATDGAEALCLFADGDYTVDVIVCDIDMEPMNGLDFLAELRSHKLQTLRVVPVIMLTSHGESTKVREAKHIGTDAYLLKPVSRASLESRMEFLLLR